MDKQTTSNDSTQDNYHTMEQAYHLRRMGPASHPENTSLICLHRMTTIIGRKPHQTDYNSCVSRRHAKIIRLPKERKFILIDDSSKGVFVNDTKIPGHVILTEGDVVTFGHPDGEHIPTGTKISQPNLKRYIFEQCSCSSSKEKECAQTSNQPIKKQDAPQISITKHLEKKSSSSSPDADIKRTFTPPILDLSLKGNPEAPKTGSLYSEEQVSKRRKCAVSPVFAAKPASEVKCEKLDNSSTDVNSSTKSPKFKAAMEPESCTTLGFIEHSNTITAERKKHSNIEPRNDFQAKTLKTESVDILPLKKEEYKDSDDIVVLSHNKADLSPVTHPPVVIQPTDCSQALMAFDSSAPSTSAENSKPNPPKSRKRVGSIIEKIKAKKRIKKRSDSPLETESSIIKPASNATIDNIGDHIAKSRNIINDLSGIICGPSKLQQLPRVKAWREEIENLQSRLEVPKTVIAVVGDTGAGKSSLINAVLDHDILPTSGMRACTAVVVEISESKSGSYESDIEFLSEKEWYNELEMLLTDLQGTDGRVKARQPDPQTEAGVAWSKIRAVYGVFQDGISLNRLKRQRGVTHWLGRTRRIKETSASSFRKQIDCYIESTDTGQGGDYWPIVKHVSVRIPNCYACSSGAILVDLPGIRDSNAARDKIARQFLKKCSAVWVVASIHRAVDDRTAKELLGEHFRRQLLMDGQYGAISFVCTKTDILVPSEIIRALDLTKQCEPFENEIAVLEAEVLDQSIKIEEMEKENEEGRKRIEELREEMREEDKDITELTQALDGVEDTEGKKELRQLEGTFRNKQKKADELDAKIRKNQSSVRELQKKKLELESSINIRQKDINALCSKARSQYSTHQIRKDFRSGIRAMRRQANLTNEEDEEDDSKEFEEEEKGLTEAVQNMEVFCVSSTEYLKLCNKLPKDGPPAVFSTKHDTGIPKLQKFVHEVTELSRRQATERLMRSVGCMVADILNYVADQGTKDGRLRNRAREKFDVHLNELKNSKISQIWGHSRELLFKLFESGLRSRIVEASGEAQDAVPGTVAKWGSKVNPDKREEGGYAYRTYKAAVSHEGVFKSPTCGQIDFNENLASPFFSGITFIWNSVFNGQLQRLLEGCKTSILDSLKRFGAALVNDLKVLGMAPERLIRVYTQHFAGAENKVQEAIVTIQDMITVRQREASRLVIPSIQTFMQPAYSHCAQQCGCGQFQRMKNHMQTFVTENHTMFIDSTTLLLIQMNELRDAIMVSLDTTLQEVMKDLNALYEPLWEAPINTQLLRDHFLPGLIRLKQPVLDMYNGADIHTDVSEIEVLKRNIDISSRKEIVTSSAPPQAVEIISARNTLRESVQRYEMPKDSRRQSVTSGKNSMLTIMDIISAIRVLEEAKILLCFGVDALNLHRIPSTTSFISICERLAKLESRLKASEDIIASYSKRIDETSNLFVCYCCFYYC
ncbi:hypothetical protein CAPTEDRAFT_212491 [Capitella teleta]|uniref:FHA domain-containing protein n=1 Tax=Capitella teleta TaxID=283909 RepID=R7V466_CAPTE|nr:hypothetical protein CAPTEDRAFT_212491 [Capitella teleta]|eukprot:ELU13237.1 hypothetical protein CAPTEDRAFT_212491 [Capitella teleta]